MNASFTSMTLPSDYKKNVVEMKRALRAQIGDVDALFRQVCQKIETEIAAAREEERRNGSAWPVLRQEDVAAGNVTPAQIAQIKRRGCLVVKQTFRRDDALAMDQSMLHYLDKNHFDEIYRGPGDNFFGSLEASRPEIYPIYWSKAQMEARQSSEIAAVQSLSLIHI